MSSKVVLKNNINSELSIEHKDDLGAVSFSTSDFCNDN